MTLNILQINLHKGKGAQSLLHQVATEESADLILVSEPNRIEANWHSDSTGKASIINKTSVPVDEVGPTVAGFCWITSNRIRLLLLLLAT